MTISNQDIFTAMVDAWEPPIVANTSVKKFTFNVISGKRIQNLCSEGKGPERMKIGKRTFYDKKKLANWLRAHTSPKGEQS